MIIKCPNCTKDFKEWQNYALHILDKHKDDDARCTWAKNSLATIPQTPIPAPVEAITPPPDVKIKKKGKVYNF